MSEDKRIIINCEAGEHRVAFLEKNTLTGYLLEREDNEKVAGNVYLGTVKNILSGIEAAFIDIGIGKNGFLHFSDIDSEEDLDRVDDEDTERKNDSEQEDGKEQTRGRGRGRGRGRARKKTVIPKVGDQVMVQVVKEQIGDKGVRLTTNISIPGRFVVFLPHSNLRGISKRISSSAERDSIKEMLRNIKVPKDSGLIVRTVSKGCTSDTLSQEVKYLNKIWRSINLAKSKATGPTCLYENLPLIQQVIRDSLTEDVKEVIIDDEKEYKRLLKFIAASCPSFKKRVKLYKEKRPIFRFYNVSSEIEKALRRKIWLKGGGYLIFDRTEALVAVDVNSGRSSGGKKNSNPEDMILKINMDAAKEIARQLQIRNIGGIIIIDFIDMRKAEHRKKLLATLQGALAQDRAKIKIYPVSKLGLVEMTRQRINETIGSEIYDRCPRCDGLGVVKSVRSVWLDMLRDIKDIASVTKEKRLRIVFPNKFLTAEILNQMHVFKNVEKKYKLRVALEPSEDIVGADYEIYSLDSGNKLV